MLYLWSFLQKKRKVDLQAIRCVRVRVVFPCLLQSGYSEQESPTLSPSRLQQKRWIRTVYAPARRERFQSPRFEANAAHKPQEPRGIACFFVCVCVHLCEHMRV